MLYPALKELVLLVIVIAIIGTSVGFAQNTVTIEVQDLGLGEEFLSSPISAADVILKVERVSVPGGGTRPTFVNLITKCLFHSDESFAGPATIICKLVDGSNGPDQFGKVVAEGRVELPAAGYTASTTVEILITQTAFLHSNELNNIQAVKIVVRGQQDGVANDREISLQVTTMQ